MHELVLNFVKKLHHSTKTLGSIVHIRVKNFGDSFAFSDRLALNPHVYRGSYEEILGKTINKVCELLTNEIGSEDEILVAVDYLTHMSDIDGEQWIGVCIAKEHNDKIEIHGLENEKVLYIVIED